MTIVLWPPSTEDVQPIENGCFTGSSRVWPTRSQAYLSEGVFALGLRRHIYLTQCFARCEPSLIEVRA
jgi:hypothetical protein